MRKNKTRGGGLALFAAVLTVCGAAPPGQADVVLDGTMGGSGALAGPDFVIDALAGRTVGTNLFHSFSQFNLTSSQSATFTNSTAASISNVLGRITDTNPSSIDGRIASTIPGANLFLMNPRGFLFGPNATLDVQGAFHATTADYIGLADGTRFNAMPSLPADALLTTAAPSAFGFLSDNPAAIAIDRSALSVPVDQTLSLIGGDLQITGSGVRNLRAAGGRINIASVGSAGEVVPSSSGEPADLRVDTFERLGGIALSGAWIDAGGDGGGTVLIRGGRLTLAGGSAVGASATGPVGVPFSGEVGSGIDVYTSGDVVMENGFLQANVFADVAVDSGGVRVRADSLDVRGPSVITSIVFFGNTTGNSGDVQIDTKNLFVQNGGRIIANTGGIGNGGDIIINTDSLEARDGGIIFTLAQGGTGKGGDIIINADRVLLSNPNLGTSLTGVTAQTFTGTGQGGNVRISADTLQILGGGNTEISAVTFGTGNAGDLDVTLTGELFMSGSRNNPFGVGLFTNTIGGSGTAGDMALTAGSLTFVDHARAAASSFGPGNAGKLTVNSGRLELQDGSSIAASAVFGTGNGGDLNVTATDIVITGVGDSLDPLNVDFTGFSTATKALPGGNMRVTASNVQVSNKGQITSTSIGAGSAGNIELRLAGSLRLTDGGQINASAQAAGDGGSIDITASDITISGTSPLGVPVISGVGSQANGIGNAGNVSLTGKTIEVLSEGIIATDTTGAGAGGDIRLTADVLTLSDAAIASGSINTGDTGNINIHVSDRFDSFNGVVSSAAAQSDGGDIAITAANRLYLVESRIEAEVRGGAGSGGNITIDPQFVVLNKSRISANAFGGPGGNIRVVTDNLIASADSAMSASSAQSIAGTVVVESPENDIAGSITQLPQEIVDVSALLPEHCAARRARAQSSFVVAGRGGVPLDPDGYLPSSGVAGGSAAVQQSSLAETGSTDKALPAVSLASFASLCR